MDLLTYWNAAGDRCILYVADHADLAADTPAFMSRPDGTPPPVEPHYGPSPWQTTVTAPGGRQAWVEARTILEGLGHLMEHGRLWDPEELVPGVIGQARAAWSAVCEAARSELQARHDAEAAEAQDKHDRQRKLFEEGAAAVYRKKGAIDVTIPEATRRVEGYHIMASITKVPTGLFLHRPIAGKPEAWVVTHEASGLAATPRLAKQGVAMAIAGALHLANPEAWRGNDLDEIRSTIRPIAREASAYFDLKTYK